MIKINMIVDPSIARMAILKEQSDNVKVYTVIGNPIKDWPTKINKIVERLQDIIDDTLELEPDRENDKIEIDLYIEKPRISQWFRGRVVEKGGAYRIHWVIAAILTVLALIPNVKISKTALIGANKWYFGLKLKKAESKIRKENAIDYAESVVEEYNIQVEKLKGDEADVICLWYWIKEFCDYEITGSKPSQTANMHLKSTVETKQDLIRKKKILKWFEKKTV